MERCWFTWGYGDRNGGLRTISSVHIATWSLCAKNNTQYELCKTLVALPWWILQGYHLMLSESFFSEHWVSGFFFWKQGKAQGEGPVCSSPCQTQAHSFPPDHLSTKGCNCKRELLCSRTPFSSVLAWSPGFYVLLSLKSSYKLHWLYTCSIQSIPLSLGAMAVPKKYTSAIPMPRLWTGWQSMFLILNGYPEEITSED